MSDKIIRFPEMPAEETGGFLLKVTLRHAKPPIWRRLLVPSGITLNQLHNIIQEAMGWYDCHLHSFRVGNLEYGIPDPDFSDDMIDDTEVRIDSIFKKEGQKILYIYDFGDDWEHDILFEERAENPDQGAVLLAGKRACPPEDCGGIWGYQNILKILRKKKLSQDDRELLEWLGDGYDPEELDIEEINEILAVRDWLECSTTDW
jgi:hypothetical protein